MSYIFNRINLIVVVVMIFLITMSMNEVAHFAKRLDLSNKAAYAQWFTSHKTVFSTQEDCQKNTGALCNYEECDYIPDGQTLSEVCGKNFTKGWRPTIVTIPEAYRDIASLQLSIGPAASRQIIEIKPNDLTIQYSSLGSSDSSVKTKPIKSHDLTLLVNNMISYEFLRIAEVLSAKAPLDPSRSSYTLILTPRSDAVPSKIYTAACLTPECPRTILDIKNDMIRFWGEPITEPTS